MNKQVLLFILAFVLGINASAQETAEFKPSGKLWGYAFGDFAYKTQGDTVGGNGRGGNNQYSNVAVNQSLFQLRRVYLGYDYEISKKFSTQFLLAAEDDFNGGDLLANGKFAPYLKLANIRWKDIFKGSDLVFGMQATPAFATTSEPIWGYRSVERTIMDIRRTSSYDLGISLQGHLPKDKNFSYTLVVSNGTGAKPENDKNKWFWADVNYKFFNQKLIVDLYSDYNRMNYIPGWYHDRNTNKLFIAYVVPKFTIGVEAFMTNLRGDEVDTKVDGVTKDTVSTKALGFSIFAKGKLYKDALGFFARYDNYNPSANNNNTDYASMNPLTSQYNPNTKEQFVTVGLDYTPVKNVHIMPNLWYNAYQNAGPKNYGSNNDAHDLVYRLTFYYIYGK
ncbi:MAG: hypothetical protein ABI378_01500 [Chitinophagaceae bacterium]